MYNLLSEEEKKMFSKTNKVWNECGFNHPFVIGMTMNLIQGCKTKQEWINKYYNSGEERKRKLESCGVITKECNSDFKIFLKNKKICKFSDYNLNVNYGRTAKDIQYISKLFREKLLDYGINITESMAMEFVLIRVIDQTWDGYKREIDILKNLEEDLGISCFHTNGKDDLKYAVDALATYKGYLLFGIQIKPVSYLNFNTNNNVKKMNKAKNKLFEEKYQVPVFYIYYNKHSIYYNFSDACSYLKNYVNSNDSNYIGLKKIV